MILYFFTAKNTISFLNSTFLRPRKRKFFVFHFTSLDLYYKMKICKSFVNFHFNVMKTLKIKESL